MLFLIKNVIFDANIMQNLYKTKQNKKLDYKKAK